MKRIALVFAAGLGLSISACSDGPSKRPLGDTCTADGDCIDGLCLSGLCLDPEADEDGDGLINRVEGALGSNPLSTDSDYDGVPDGEEVSGIDPRDSDGDGRADILESLVVDADHDCLPDELDPDNGTVASDLSAAIPFLCSKQGVCLSSIGNVRLECDDQQQPHCIYTDIPTYQAEESTCDGLDNDCDGHADEGFRDSDGDGIADCADDDVDGDGAAQATDNCPELANEDQADADGDQKGDACDAPSAPKLGAFASPTNDTSPAASGTGEKLSIVRVYTDASCTTKVGEGAANGQGAFSFDLTLPGAGLYELFVQAENSAGLTSACTAGGEVEIDLTAPVGPRNVFARASAWTETGATFDFSGLVEPFAAVDIYVGTGCDGEPLRVAAGEDGTFSTSGTYDNETNLVSFKVTDLAGNSTCVDGPALFGVVTIVTRLGEEPEVGVPVVFSYPDGSSISETSTGDDGTAKETIFAGCGATVATDAWEGYARWVTVLDLAPGETVPFYRAPPTLGLDRSDAIVYEWPEIPAGTWYLDFHTACGSTRMYLDGQTSWSTYYYGGCLGTTTFDAAVVAYDNSGLPTAFAFLGDNLVPENSDQQTTVAFTMWRTDFDVFSVTYSGLSAAAPVDFSVSSYDDLVQWGAGGDYEFAYGTTTLEASLPKIDGAVHDYRARVMHLSATGSDGSRAVWGKGNKDSHVDVDLATLPPRIFDAGWYYQSGIDTGAYTGFRWAGEPGLSHAVEAGLFEGSFYSQYGTLDWKVVMGPRGDDGVVDFPKVGEGFPGASFVAAIYYPYDGNVTFWDYADRDGYAAFVAGCAKDIVGCITETPKATYTSCCSSGGRGK